MSQIPPKTLDLINQYFSLYPEGWVSASSPMNLPSLLVSTLIHGDEPIGLYVMDQILRQEKDLALSVAFLLGHEVAAREGRRFLEKDVNRLFGIPEKNEASPDERVTLRFEQILESFTKQEKSLVTIDMHQSREASLSHFMILLDRQENYALARTLDPSAPLILFKESLGYNAYPEYCLEKGFLAALTLELGNRFDQSEQLIKIGVDMIKRAVSFAEDSETAIHYWQTKRNTRNDDKLYLWRDDLHFEKSLWTLRPGIKNLTPIKKGEILGKHTQKTQSLISPCEGVVIFPQYDKSAKQDGDICVFCENYSIQ